MEKITLGDSSLDFDPASNTLVIQGSMRLANLTEYEPVKDYLFKSSEKTSGNTLSIDMKQLKFLNSSGITTLSMFVIAMKKRNTKMLKIIGSKEVSWQEKSLVNFNKLWNKVAIVME